MRIYLIFCRKIYKLEINESANCKSSMFVQEYICTANGKIVAHTHILGFEILTFHSLTLIVECLIMIFIDFCFYILKRYISRSLSENVWREKIALHFGISEKIITGSSERETRNFHLSTIQNVCSPVSVFPWSDWKFQLYQFQFITEHFYK